MVFRTSSHLTGFIVKPQSYVCVRTGVRNAHIRASLLFCCPSLTRLRDYVNMIDRSMVCTIWQQEALNKPTKRKRNKSWVYHQISSVFMWWWWCFMQRTPYQPTNQKFIKCCYCHTLLSCRFMQFFLSILANHRLSLWFLIGFKSWTMAINWLKILSYTYAKCSHFWCWANIYLSS